MQYRMTQIFHLFCIWLITGTLSAQNDEELTFSHQGGLYNETFDLELIFSDDNAVVRFTTDGNLPNPQSELYQGPILLDENRFSDAQIYRMRIAPEEYHFTPDRVDVPKAIVIRAAVFGPDGNRISSVITENYFISASTQDHGGLPIMCINADHSDLFDEEYGIFVPGVHWDESEPDWTGNYHQRGREWERDAHISMYMPDGSTALDQDIGLRTHGGNVRRYPQKGMRLYARNEYGSSHFDYPIFEESELNRYKRLVLKPFASSWTDAGIEDLLSSHLARTLDVDFLAMRPVVVYINGEYWGLYYLQERADERYVAAHHEVDKDSIDLIENWWGATTSGDATAFNAFIDKVDKNSFAIIAAFEDLAREIDIASLIDYYILQIFIANRDWPVNNMKCWKSKIKPAQWRWIFFDGDAGFTRSDYDMFARLLIEEDEDDPNVPRSSLLFRRLMENEAFRKSFFERMEYVLNNILSPDQSQNKLASIYSQINREIHRQSKRFQNPYDRQSFNEDLANITDFLNERPCHLSQQVKEYFGVELKISPCDEQNKDPSVEFEIWGNPSSRPRLFFQTEQAQFVNIIISHVNGQEIKSRVIFLPYGQTVLWDQWPDLGFGLYIVTMVNDSGSKSYVFTYYE